MTGPSVEGREAVEARAAATEAALVTAVRERVPLVVVKAPPGSGKTTLLVAAAAAGVAAGQRVAVGAQTNSQANDICMRLAQAHPGLVVHRFASQDADPVDLGDTVVWSTAGKDLAAGACVVVSTIAKWGLTEKYEPFDVLLVDEAWQMAWAEFMLCARVASRFILIGDPGQIDPVVTIATERWETAVRGPHRPAPETLLADPSAGALVLELPACRRLPHDSVELVRAFYDFPFAAWAQPGERHLDVGAPTGTGDDLDRALGRLAERSVVAHTLETPPDGPPYLLDRDLADLAVEAVRRLLERESHVNFEGERRRLTPDQVGVVAIHRVLNDAIRRTLPAKVRDRVMVDTAERWQGLERDVMIALHPLSGTTRPTTFELETGRLCVMASRHRVGLIVLARDHVPTTLAQHIPLADQALGRSDVTSRGHAAHTRFWGAVSGGPVA